MKTICGLSIVLLDFLQYQELVFILQAIAKINIADL